MRREVEERTGMHAVDVYGLSEVIGPGVAVESVEAKGGLHVWEDHFYPEVVDPVTVTVAVEVLEPGAVQRSEGKAQRVVDRRPRG